ncbi:retron Ec67 family RNA-directed DNA polymerase/endonuclease [Enterococcus hulanensis]|uniref:RNA-directed DNA polymerase n=1 Tax=Enterococcus hulanensis TaxID=2559929 RepID=A0ABU3EZH5_9ENTE|nr:retron Ec67 family RNA-directed DNA polymerase/endonuclease [Enterococcus hulanensis]MDT2600281.1 retron Ec67 family RNA-directed DNA polymerase/endonuclease [Enterococcus hulanensis]MDT2609094.1 retron Ec67 family RNA-directed DNA polymerase/endonuclease [Enterococcus hulanensis]MDT2616864.1 retron Ec67 family RNA-directed DNA polymerase/endonuclease [Enterococcus hulanensis]MDT2628616.1 retron Ec67 family RNA-directed DNA polymerase/endonuclease [Enterococcus hulanensis]MDT2655956.1 retro
MMNKLKNVKTRDEFADLINVPKQKLTYILYKKVENLYSSFEIPKKDGSLRKIDAPMKDLRDIQKKLANLLTVDKRINQEEKGIRLNISHGFERDKSIITNAKIHRNKRFVFNIDLENFFQSFHFGRVKGFFEKNQDYKLPSEIATVIAQLTCYNRTLPQGAPTSPIITNLICNILDMRLLKIAKRYKLDYSRYADDLTFSTNDKNFLDLKSTFYDELNEEIKKAGFRINEQKNRLQFKDSRQTVTGLIVNKNVNVDRRYYKDTRAMAHSLYKTGSFEIDNEAGTINQLEGRFSFINQIQWYNNMMDSNNHDFRKLNSREKQYQAFLFYKYFFANNKLTILTEGKTDIKYLKSALKKYYNEYPELISRKSNGDFEFKINFLRRTKRLQYFFGLYQDGASPIKNVYNYFVTGHGENFPNYLEYFQKLSGNNPRKPTVLIFDNEIANKNKPLANFANYVKLKESERALLENEHQIKLLENLFLVTNPLIGEKTECEIEDLFSKKVLEHKIGGKSFSREKNADSGKYYGKEIFANFIVKEYSNIDFTNFKPMLDNLNNINKNYK